MGLGGGRREEFCGIDSFWPLLTQKAAVLVSFVFVSVSCHRDAHNLDSFLRYSLKLAMLYHLFDAFRREQQQQSSARGWEAGGAAASFLAWLKQTQEVSRFETGTTLREALSQTFGGKGVPSGGAQTQLLLTKTFNAVVRREALFRQCKPEDSRIVSEWLGSLASFFPTVNDLDSFLRPKTQLQQQVRLREIQKTREEKTGFASCKRRKADAARGHLQPPSAFPGPFHSLWQRLYAQLLRFQRFRF